MKFPIRPFDNLPQFDFMRLRHAWVWGSLILTLLVVGLLGVRGLNYGIDFAGGKLVQVQIVSAPQVAQVREALNAGGFGSATIQSYGAADEFLIRLGANDEALQGLSEATVTADTVESRIQQALSAKLGEVQLRRVEFVGPQVGDELRLQGLIAMIAATVGILIYVWARFELRYALGAILALVHDTVLVIGVLCLLQTEITLTVLAAVMTLIGYSLNDTIVIFDRIREMRQRFPEMPLTEVINRSVNQTMSRTIMTAGTTLLVLLCLFWFGGAVIHDFAMILAVGVLLGTYSSVFVAGPVLLVLENYYQKLAREKAARDAAAPAP